MANVLEEFTPTQTKSTNYFMKVVIIGDSGVGKTSILQSYINNNFSQNGYKATIGSDLYITDVSIQDHYAQLQIWDTAGQERYNSLSKQLYRGTDILILVYDITNLESFTNIEHWKNDFLSTLPQPISKPKHDQQPFPTLLLGNKLDLVEKNESLRQVPIEKADEYAAGHDMQFKEVSALTQLNIHPAFQDIAVIAMNKRTIPLVYKIDDSFVLPSVYHNDNLENNQQNNNRQNNDSSSCYCQLL